MDFLLVFYRSSTRASIVLGSGNTVASARYGRATFSSSGEVIRRCRCGSACPRHSRRSYRTRKYWALEGCGSRSPHDAWSCRTRGMRPQETRAVRMKCLSRRSNSQARSNQIRLARIPSGVQRAYFASQLRRVSRGCAAAPRLLPAFLEFHFEGQGQIVLHVLHMAAQEALSVVAVMVRAVIEVA